MTDYLKAIMFPIIFLVLFQIVFTAYAPDESFLDDAVDTTVCAWPSYNDGIDAGSVTCSVIDHPTPYSEDVFVIWNATGAWYSGGADWIASIPIGWGTYTADLLTSFFARIGSAMVAGSLILFPVANFEPILGATLVAMLIGGFVILYFTIIICLYKLINPLVS